MTNNYSMPDPEKVKKTVAKLRQARLELAEVNLEWAEINARLEHDICQQRLKMIQKSKQNTAESLSLKQE